MTPSSTPSSSSGAMTTSSSSTGKSLQPVRHYSQPALLLGWLVVTLRCQALQATSLPTGLCLCSAVQPATTPALYIIIVSLLNVAAYNAVGARGSSVFDANSGGKMHCVRSCFQWDMTGQNPFFPGMSAAAWGASSLMT